MHSKYGFITTDPFRPRIVGAGLWFFVCSAIPITAAIAYRTSSWNSLKKRTLLWSLFLLVFPMVIVCFDTSAYGGPSWSWLALAVIAFALATWFGMVFGFALLTLNEVESHIRNSWSLRLALLLTIFATFAEVFYPNIKSSWGGGAPVNVTIFFTKDSVVKPGQKVTAQLIEESDQGFYVGAPKEAEALFIRRSDVALIYFSDKPSDSALLK